MERLRQITRDLKIVDEWVDPFTYPEDCEEYKDRLRSTNKHELSRELRRQRDGVRSQQGKAVQLDMQEPTLVRRLVEHADPRLRSGHVQPGNVPGLPADPGVCGGDGRKVEPAAKSAPRTHAKKKKWVWDKAKKRFCAIDA